MVGFFWRVPFCKRFDEENLSSPPTVQNSGQSGKTRFDPGISANLITGVLPIIHAGGRINEPSEALIPRERVAVPIMQSYILSGPPLFKQRSLQGVCKTAVQHIGTTWPSGFKKVIPADLRLCFVDEQTMSVGPEGSNVAGVCVNDL